MITDSIIIIGAGPAGIAAAVQLKRYGINALIFEKREVGGLLRNAYKLENYLGFPDGINGLDLAKKLKAQLAQHDIKIITEQVKLLDLINNRFFSVTTNKTTYYADKVIIATGTVQKIPVVIENMPDKLQNKVYYEVCDLKNLQNKKIAIIGASDAAFDYALTLSQANHVYIFNRGNKIKAIKPLKEQVLINKKIVYQDDYELMGLKQQAETMVLKFNTKSIAVDYLLIAVGRKPAKEFYSRILQNEEEQLIESKVLHLIGDIKNGIYRQASLAVADGIKTAMKISMS